MSNQHGPICVTGASGYVAGHVVRELLERGFAVRGTVRDPGSEAKVGHLKRLAGELPGSLELYAADLLQPGSFDEAVAGSEVVIHTASPFLLGGSADPQKDLVDPAVSGTNVVIDAVEATPSVRRVVLTASVAAIFGDNTECADRGGVFTEAHWNETSSLTQNPYSLSKTLAERAGWERVKGQDRWDLVTINPGFVMGPSLTSRNDSASIDFLLALIDGRRRSGLWDLHTPWVDVREVATAHVEAALRPDAEGRHILVADSVNVWDLIPGLDAAFPGKLKLPGLRVPKWMAYLVGPLNGYSMAYVRRNVGVPIRMDNTRSRERLGVEYRPVADTLRDHVEQLIRDGLFLP